MNEISQLNIPERMNMAWYACDRWADSPQGELPALLHEGEPISWKELQQEVNRIGNSLLTLGVGRGDRVLLRSINCLELYYAILACMKIGSVPVPTSSLFRSGELQHIVEDTGAVAAIVHPDNLEAMKDVGGSRLRHVIVIGEGNGHHTGLRDLTTRASAELDCADTSSEDEAFMLYTSGTTSIPKGIVHAHRWLIATGEPIARQEMELQPGDVTLSVSEINWMYPFGCNFLYPFYCGAAAGLYQGRFDPEKSFEHMARYGATHFIGNPTIFKRMLLVEEAENKWDCSRLRMGLSSGETLAPNIFKSWLERFGCEIYDSMGQTEIHIFCCTRPGVVKMSSMGKPFPGVPPVSVVDETGKELPQGEVGLLAISAAHPGLALRYENQPAIWQSRFAGGWYLTGDMSYIDEEGFFWFVSRSDDLIKSRGYLVSPKEVEDTLQEHPAVLEAAVVGKEDPILGQRIEAVVVLRPGQQASADLAADIQEMVRGRIAPFKVPKKIVFTEELPKTVTGKILRRELRKG